MDFTVDSYSGLIVAKMPGSCKMAVQAVVHLEGRVLIGQWDGTGCGWVPSCSAVVAPVSEWQAKKFRLCKIQRYFRTHLSIRPRTPSDQSATSERSHCCPSML